MAARPKPLNVQAAALTAEIAANGSASIGDHMGAANHLEAQGLICITDGEAKFTAAGQFASRQSTEPTISIQLPDGTSTPAVPMSVATKAIDHLKESDRKRRKAPPVKETEADRQVSNDLYQGTADELRQFIEIIEQCEAEKKDISDQIKEVYAELKGRGFDAKAIRRVVSLRKKDPQVRQEEDAILEVYLTALGMN